MPPSLMASQFATLEDTVAEPDAVTVSVKASPHEVVNAAMVAISRFTLTAGP
jgi:gluconate kinase